MKRMKKLASFLLAAIMVLSMTVSAFAAESTKVTINGEGKEYAAYQLLSAVDGSTEDEVKIVYSVNSKYASVLTTVTGCTEDSDILAYIEKLDDDGIRAFADKVYKVICAAEITADATTESKEFSVDQGYYLIAETKTASSTDTISLVMLNTAGNTDITVTTKEDVPTLVKKVKETNDSTGVVTDWQDGADYDINDDVPFKLTGTVTSKLDSYDTYYYVFHDKMSDGLTFNNDVEVYVGNSTTPVAEDYYTVVTETDDGCTFEVVFEDLKDVPGVTAGCTITVEFTAKLNSEAVIGTPGNPNEAKLEYSNNPYNTGDSDDDDDDKPDETGETPWDKVVVFTYVLNADKVDGNGDALEGAGFTLYKYDAEAADWVKIGDEITGVTTFTFSGLDAGEYKLVETTVPAGYNKADDILFTIEATYDTEAVEPELTGLAVKDADGNTISEGEEAVFSTVVTAGSVNTDVENLTGTKLPETGGIGTTIFYVLGAVLVIGAVVVLVTKKRMSVNK